MDFWTEFKQQTEPNPFHKQERVWKARVVFDLKSDSIYDNAVTLRMIRSVFRGERHGSEGLCWLSELADRHGVILSGWIEPSGKTRPRLNLRQLTAWYRRHGFTVSRTYRLTRKPRGSR